MNNTPSFPLADKLAELCAHPACRAGMASAGEFELFLENVDVLSNPLVDPHRVQRSASEVRVVLHDALSLLPDDCRRIAEETVGLIDRLLVSLR